MVCLVVCVCVFSGAMMGMAVSPASIIHTKVSYVSAVCVTLQVNRIPELC
jgi:hypothetical protein